MDIDLNLNHLVVSILESILIAQIGVAHAMVLIENFSFL